jgi:ubiquinol-cytochrome c reductase cytochrome b subunit
MAVSLDRRNGFLEFLYWIWNELDRTIFTAIKFSFPARFVSPFGFLGMLTFIMFITLGVTGALLMFYYEPIMTRSWDSVAFINNEVPFGFHIRNLHYHGSNAMVMLAILHMYYQYFSGRYKIRNEILWVTGVILGTVTILEAFTGYDIIFSERAELAISIAASLTNSIPIAGPMIRDLAFGAGFHDFVLRFYAQHVFILPIVMLGLMAVHFPRFLVFDVPMVMAICGAMCLAGGVFPVDLGFKFEPTVPPGITVPEWYLTGLYAFLRTQYDKFLTGVLWPALFIGVLLLTPFLDRYKKFSWKDRPWMTALGITGISQILVTTYWGFYIPPDTTIPLVERLVIDPINLYLVMILLVPLSFGFTLVMIHLAKEAERKAKLAKANGPKKVSEIKLSIKWTNWMLVGLLAFQVFLNIAAFNAFLSGMNNVNLWITGVILITFAGFFHLYRYAMAQSKNIPKPPKLPTTKSLETAQQPPVMDQTKPSEKKSPQGQVSESVTPEIKANTAELDLDKDPNTGMSDLNKP